MARTALAALEHSRLESGVQAAATKLALLKALSRRRLGSARSVARLHEALCFIRAYPDDAAVLAQAEAMLASFPARADLRTHRSALADSGIAGTAIRYRFFAGQAQWLARRWPAQLRLDRRDTDAEARIARALPALLSPVEAQALVEAQLPGCAALDRLRGDDETDAVFLLRRIAALPGSSVLREVFADSIDAGFVLAAGPDTPSRTAAHFAAGPIVLPSRPPRRERPDLRAEMARPPRGLRRLSIADGEAVIDQARGAMVTRARSLEAFSFADARDTWLVDDGDGLAFALIGVIPERRHFLASWYGALVLRNRVPIGYAQSDLTGRSAALSFNIFETFRGGEAEFSFARWLAALRQVFGTTSFSVEPYQLGRDNDEALESGAWWFYARLGFAPRDAATARLTGIEQARLRRDPRHRSSAAVLRRLAARHLFFDLDPACPHPLVPTDELGLRAGAALSTRAGSARQRAIDEAAAELMRRCAQSSLKGFSPDQREAWRRLAPVVAMLDLGDWPPADLLTLAGWIRAKGGRSEREFIARWLAHPRLDEVIRRWAAARVNRR